MQINIKTSEKNQEVIRRLTAKLPDGTKENAIARIAIGYSLQMGKIFQFQDFSKYDSKGKEYKDHVLFDSKHREFYIALICQHYGLNKNSDSIPKFLKLHLDHGLELLGHIFENNANYAFFDFLAEKIDKGTLALTGLKVSLDHVINNQQRIRKEAYSSLIKIPIGHTIDLNENVFLSLNNSALYNNSHIAVAGNSGTGKTQFALYMLSKIHELTKGDVNFIYLDFKGLKHDDVNRLQGFFTKTSTQFVDVPQTPFPVNPLTFIDNINEVNKTMGIDKFVDIICKYSALGIKQKGTLREAVRQAFLKQKGGTYPSLSDIKIHLNEISGDKKDSLTEIIEELCRYNIFIDDPKNQSNFINKNIYLSLSGDLSNSVRFTSLFLIINYLYNIFMNMDDSNVDNHIRSIRYVILIDEAHEVFKEKKYQDILQKLLRVIRSKGVSIVLLSQGIDEYNQPDFDFSSLCEISILLNIKDKNVKSMEKFLGTSGDNSKTIARSMERIQPKQAISNIKEYEIGKLFHINGYVSNCI